MSATEIAECSRRAAGPVIKIRSLGFYFSSIINTRKRRYMGENCSLWCNNFGWCRRWNMRSGYKLVIHFGECENVPAFVAMTAAARFGCGEKAEWFLHLAAKMPGNGYPTGWNQQEQHDGYMGNFAIHNAIWRRKYNKEMSWWFLYYNLTIVSDKKWSGIVIKPD